jgi:hypothetical protein
MMRNFDIRTTLMLSPTVQLGPEVTYLTRGSTATLHFDLGKKFYSFEDLDQLTFMLKQGKNLYWYKMFTYLDPTQDTEVVEGKPYYRNIECNSEDPFACTAELVTNIEGSPAGLGLYEEVEGNVSWRDCFYIVDPHFTYAAGEGFSYINLVLQSKETAEFKPCNIDNPIQVEVAVRLNTDKFASLGNTDSIIIEPQMPVVVLDSLYSRIV